MGLRFSRLRSSAMALSRARLALLKPLKGSSPAVVEKMKPTFCDLPINLAMASVTGTTFSFPTAGRAANRRSADGYGDSADYDKVHEWSAVFMGGSSKLIAWRHATIRDVSSSAQYFVWLQVQVCRPPRRSLRSMSMIAGPKTGQSGPPITSPKNTRWQDRTR